MRQLLDRIGVGAPRQPLAVRLFTGLSALVLAGVFLAAAVPKILDPAGFALAIFRYQVLPDALVNLTALYIPWLELVTAVALLAVPRMRVPAALLFLGLLALFTVLIALNLYRGIDVACGCFSTNPEAGHFGWLLIARNAVLIVLAGVVLRNAECRMPSAE